MSLGKNIQKIRKENKLSQEQLAQKCNVSRQTISRWESDEVLPDTNNLITLSKLFNVTLDSLVFDQSNDSTPKVKNHKWINLIIIFVFVFSIVMNVILMIPSPSNKIEKSIYGDWVLNENGYNILLSIAKSNEKEDYDVSNLYLFYKDEFESEELEKQDYSFEYIIQDNEQLGVRYKFSHLGHEFYYDEDSYQITLKLSHSLGGKTNFTLKKVNPK